MTTKNAFVVQVVMRAVQLGPPTGRQLPGRPSLQRRPSRPLLAVSSQAAPRPAPLAGDPYWPTEPRPPRAPAPPRDKPDRNPVDFCRGYLRRPSLQRRPAPPSAAQRSSAAQRHHQLQRRPAPPPAPTKPPTKDCTGGGCLRPMIRHYHRGPPPRATATSNHPSWTPRRTNQLAPMETDDRRRGRWTRAARKRDKEETWERGRRPRNEAALLGCWVCRRRAYEVGAEEGGDGGACCGSFEGRPGRDRGTGRKRERGGGGGVAIPGLPLSSTTRTDQRARGDPCAGQSLGLSPEGEPVAPQLLSLSSDRTTRRRPCHRSLPPLTPTAAPTTRPGHALGRSR